MIANESFASAVPYRSSERVYASMRKDHFGFALFLGLMLIAPEISVSAPGLPGNSTLSVGFVGLLVWAVLSPHHLVKISRPGAMVIPIALVMFSIYVWALSLSSGETIPLAYASQYLFYVVFGYFLLSGYFNRAIRFQQFGLALAILSAVGLVYAVGVIVSFWTGPLYPSQSADLSQTYGTLKFRRALGFAGAVNVAGAVLVVFTALALFVPFKIKVNLQWLLIPLMVTALMLTSSRGAIVAFSLALLLLVPLKLLSFAGTKKDAGPLIVTFSVIFLIGVIIAGSFVVVPSLAEVPWVAETMNRLGAGEENQLAIDSAARGRIWERGMADWNQSGIVGGLFGEGFRASQAISRQVWVTPHNAYISMLNDFGLLGLLIFVLPLLSLVVILAMRIISRRQSTLESFAFVALVGTLINNMTGLFFYSPKIITLIMIVVILMTLSRRQNRLAQGTTF